MKLAALLMMALAALAVVGATARPALAHPMACDKAPAGIEKQRCERHEKMAAQCGPLKGEQHHACDRSFLLANPLACSTLTGAEAQRCEAEKAATKTCEPMAGRAFIVCVRDSIKESPLGPH